MSIDEVVEEIVKDISDRRGLKWEWEKIDADIQEEIKDTWANIIREHLEF